MADRDTMEELAGLFAKVIGDDSMPFVFVCVAKDPNRDVLLWRGTRSQILGMLEIADTDIPNKIYSNNSSEDE